MPLEPRTLPDEEPDLGVAVQASAQPTRKVVAATVTGGSLGAVVGGVMAGFGGPAIIEALGAWGQAHPSISGLIVTLVTSIAAFYAVKYGGQAGAYNVLDKPNVPLKAAK